MAADTPSQTTGQGFIPAAPAPSEPAKPADVARPIEVSKPAGGEVAGDRPAPATTLSSSLHDQLARIEDKCSRIEDKYARSEALLSRVDHHIESATGRMGEAARQSDLTALRTEVRAVSDRVRAVPGTGALVLTALITSVLTVILLVAVQRLQLDSMIPQRNAPAPAAQQ